MKTKTPPKENQMYAIAPAQVAANNASIIASSLTVRELMARRAAAQRGRLYVRSTRVR
jgi:hypothetical protein